jgi:hypothetical protein
MAHASSTLSGVEIQMPATTIQRLLSIPPGCAIIQRHFFRTAMETVSMTQMVMEFAMKWRSKVALFLDLVTTHSLRKMMARVWKVGVSSRVLATMTQMQTTSFFLNA